MAALHTLCSPGKVKQMKKIGDWLVCIVLRSVHAGGNLNNGAVAGLAARYSSNDLAGSSTIFGSRLSYEI